MAGDADELPFKFLKVEDKIQLEVVSYNGSKKWKLEVSGGIFEATSLVQGEPTDHWKKIVSAQVEGSHCFLTLHALQERLKDSDLRRDDSDAIRKDDKARPFELWYSTGSKANIPTTLVLLSGSRRKPYDSELDARQLEEWVKVAKTLGGKPPENFNPMYGRFSLRPPDALKKEAGKELVYCSPAKSPAFGVTKDKLKAIIAANTGKFDHWPDPVVIDFEEAKRKGLRLVGQNFLQFYSTWMKADYYEKLWKEYKVSELLHAFPAEGDEKTYQDIDDKTLIAKIKRTGAAVDGTPTIILLKNPGTRKGTETIMGKSATDVAAKLWGDKVISSGMGGSVKVEWLHRVAHALGGADAFKNLVFGTWECNTDMVRAENFIRKLTEKVGDNKYEGKLTTINKAPGAFSRRNTLRATNTDATIPTWATKYSWLCCSLIYQYHMDNGKCPLDGGVAHEIEFDPLSLYVPLSMEPRLDTYILDDLKSGGSSVDTVSNKPPIVSNLMVIPEPPSTGPLLDNATLVWNAAANGLPSVELPDIVIDNPTIGQLADDPIVQHPSRPKRSIPTERPTPHGGFVLQGKVYLFRTAVFGSLQKWYGPPPDGVAIGIDPPSIERVVIPEDFHLSQLIPLLGGTPFEKIIFRNVTIYHQNYAFDKTKSIGWHFNADWVIDQSCGLLYDVLRTVLQVDKPTLSIRAAFGKSLHWNVPLNLQSFTLEGIFSKLTLSPFPGLTLTTIGVRLLGIRGFSFTPEPHSTLSFGFDVFGMMKLSVPGSVVPLNLDYEIRLVEKTVSLRAEISGSIWEDALGVEGLLLKDVVFGTSFSTSSPLKTLSFDVSATFSYLSSVAYLQGSYATGGHFALTAELDNFGIKELNDLFYALFGNFLTLPDFDVHVGSAIVSIASGQGLSISLLDVTVAGYTAVSVEVTLSSSGASLSGALSSSAITFGDVELHNALMKLAFWTTDKKKNVDLMLGGKLRVDFLNLEVGAAVHLYPGNSKVEWAVVAELSAPDKPFAISDVAPALKGTFVDFSLQNAVIIAASQDDPLISQSFPSYPVKKGFQVFGVIERIQALDDLLHAKVKGLVFNAGWSNPSGFNLMVSLPAESSINLGHGIKTTPITLGIQTNPIELAIMAGLTVPVKDSTPLDFSFVLAANATGAIASAQMEGWWVKPFGIENMKIGPEVTLSIKIVYATFVTTGTPSGFGLSGGLMIGSTTASLAVNMSEDPKRELLYGEVQELDISDVVEFAGTLIQENIPKIPDNLLKFEELKIYVCPFGVVLGKTVYPQGFSFKADLLVFDKRANIDCTIDKAQKSIDIVGGIDNFKLGPLAVHGSKGPRATLECHVGVSKQKLIVDGVVSLFDAQAQTYVNVQFLPTPQFKFDLLLKWADVFTFKLDAELLNSTPDKLSEADFSFRADLENNILEYIAQQIIEQFEAAKVAATQGLETAQNKVEDAKKGWKNAVEGAQKRLDNAQKKWESYEKQVRSDSQPVIDRYLSEITRMEDKVDAAGKDYQSALDSAEGAVNQANHNRASALASAQRHVANARQSMDNAIDSAQQTLDDAKAALSRAFGNAQRDIDGAQQKVDGIQNEIDDTERTIREYEDASGLEFWKKAAIPALWGWVGTLEASKAVATAALDAAHAILNGGEYAAKQLAVGTASKALDVAKSAGEGALSTAQEALRAADQTSKATVDAANTTLEGVKQGGEYIAFKSAKETLEGFKQANKAAYDAAMAAIKGLMDSLDFIAFNTAKAGLEVAKSSTKILDAAKEALVLAEKASQAALSILEEVVKFAAKAVDINTIVLSGTLRGILGIGGSTAQPLKAVVKGYVVGQSFDIEAEFDPRKPVEFITALFKQLWNLVSTTLKSGQMAAPVEQHHLVKREAMEVVIQPGPLLAASSRFLQERPDVLKMLVDDSASIPTDIPRGPFSGRPIVSSVVVARKALLLIQEERGISTLKDLDGMQG